MYSLLTQSKKLTMKTVTMIALWSILLILSDSLGLI